MKKISFLKYTTFFEIVLNTILALLFFTGIFANMFELTANVIIGAGILHLTSMVLHWLAWNQLPTTHKARVIFNFWVIGSFLLAFTCFIFFESYLVVIIYLLLLFAVMWFIYYCMILFKEYGYLKRRKELYQQRELVHF